MKLKPDVMSVRQAAEFLGISKASVHKAIGKGKMKAINIDGFVLVVAKDVKKYKIR